MIAAAWSESPSPDSDRRGLPSHEVPDMTDPITPPPTPEATNDAEKRRQYAQDVASLADKFGDSILGIKTPGRVDLNPLDALLVGIKGLCRYSGGDLDPAAENEPAVRGLLESQLASGQKPNIEKGRPGYGIA